ncbi:bone morphogenetic protein receptor type-2 [Musca domestica]|uniref:receptor protein serine/threonine kinase n=1 Tax=Musca domestica TaxID=7370 RepID=A0A1I8MX34_MUSDO|nr:bone morphogenetic protein receptor type-2 [Musca domestica]
MFGRNIPTIALYLIITTTLCRAAPEPFSCMSYLEDDGILLEEEEDRSDKSYIEPPQFDVGGLTSKEYSRVNEETEKSQEATIHLRVCPPEFTFCFSLWRKTENGSKIEKQGCWKDSTEGNGSCSHAECVSSSPTLRNNSLYYCCCSGNACNRKVAVVEPSFLELSKNNYADSNPPETHEKLYWSKSAIWLGMLAIIMVVTVISSFIYCRSVREKPIPEEAPLAPSGPGYSSNLRNVDNLNLICMLDKGKYGTVMKGLLHDQEVAVKIFPEAHQQYFINERNIYSLPLMDCPALLTYFGYDERHTLEGKVEYHLVLSLAPFGCLQDWLIPNAMNFETFCGMVKSITRGLSHLHTELRRGDDHKPCIAHRDLNTRNILVKSDLSCCIADFGFALKVFGPRYEYKGEIAEAETKSINEVGTLRYMAPELLEGAVNLRDCETSLKQMDVYALGLVLWEVATRCSDFYPPGQPTPPYKAPYELEVGSHPSFDQMQSLVVRHKARPLFPAGWGGGPAVKLIRDTCEDCWDHDAEARLTSLCAEERMHEAASIGMRLNGHLPATTPLLSTNNLSNGLHESMDHNHKPRSPTNVDPMVAETNTVLNPPPNKKNLPYEVNNCERPSTTEKNHLIQPQQQIQPYQGRNPCQERNLAPSSMNCPQQLIQRSKKHSFQTPTGEENSFSCLDDDVSVEELIAARSSKKFPSLEHEEHNPINNGTATHMGQGFPKQQNTERKLKGWHGVRALIQKKLFRKADIARLDAFRQLNGDEKSNLVEKNHHHQNHQQPQQHHSKPVVISFIDREKVNCGKSNSVTLPEPPHQNGYAVNKRPNNLDLSPVNQTNGFKLTPQNPITTIAEETDINDDASATTDNVEYRLKSLDKRKSTPAHNVVSRSKSSNLVKSLNSSNNNLHEAELKALNDAVILRNHSASEPQFRRQRSLEVFREVFNARGSNERLRDPSQRVKTPGDVPPSVRKIRASKTLSLYDDRMMDSSLLNVL